MPPSNSLADHKVRTKAHQAAGKFLCAMPFDISFHYSVHSSLSGSQVAALPGGDNSINAQSCQKEPALSV